MLNENLNQADMKRFGHNHETSDKNAQCARTDLNKRFLPKPMTTTG